MISLLYHHEGLVVRNKASSLGRKGGAQKGKNKIASPVLYFCLDRAKQKKQGCSELLWTQSELVPGTAERHRVALFPRCHRCSEAQGSVPVIHRFSFSEAGTVGALQGN